MTISSLFETVLLFIQSKFHSVLGSKGGAKNEMIPRSNTVWNNHDIHQFFHQRPILDTAVQIGDTFPYRVLHSSQKSSMSHLASLCWGAPAASLGCLCIYQSILASMGFTSIPWSDLGTKTCSGLLNLLLKLNSYFSELWDIFAFPLNRSGCCRGPVLDEQY